MVPFLYPTAHWERNGDWNICESCLGQSSWGEVATVADKEGNTGNGGCAGAGCGPQSGYPGDKSNTRFPGRFQSHQDLAVCRSGWPMKTGLPAISMVFVWHRVPISPLSVFEAMSADACSVRNKRISEFNPRHSSVSGVYFTVYSPFSWCADLRNNCGIWVIIL